MSALRPTRGQLQDGGLLLALGLVSSTGFHGTYSGWTFLVAALCGWLLGILIAQIADATGKPAVLLALFVVVAFFLLGGAVARHQDGLVGVLPLPGTLRELAEQSIYGWKDLLTTLAPVDGGPLLTLPYLMGLIAGAAGMALADRRKSAFAPVIAPLAYLVAVILLGVPSPERLALIGATFAVLTVWLIALRAGRSGTRTGSRTSWKRRGAAAGLIVASAALATSVAEHLPFTQNHERVVLRNYVSPPFDTGEYASPLVAFRKYTKGYRVREGTRRLYDTELLKVEGKLPKDRLLKFASLDRYDGLVWGAANRAAGSTGTSGTFQRVGSVIRSGATGDAFDLKVTIGPGYDGAVWLPGVGALAAIKFQGTDLASRGQHFRYNIDSATGVVPQGLHKGDSYLITGLARARVADASLEPASSTQVTTSSDVDFVPVAQKWSGGAAGPMQQVLAIAHHLRDTGRYTDGEAQFAQYLAGHSVNRLSKFSADGQQIAGNDEQYAAMLAVLANAIGVPARVAVGALVPQGGVVTGKDVRAWVELRDQSGEWRVLPTEEFMSRERPPEQENPKPEELVAGEAVPPPAPVRPPTTDGDPFNDTLSSPGKSSGSGFQIPLLVTLLVKFVAVPTALLALPFVLVVLYKAKRRKRRRTRGVPATRLAGAWREMVDQARDLGSLTYAQRTRREQARDLGFDVLSPMANLADAYVFGPGEPTDEDAAGYWREVDAARVGLAAGASRFKRLKAAVSPASLRKLSKEVIRP